MIITVVLFGYAAAVAVLAPRLLCGLWLHRSPRLALLLWHAAGASVLLAVVLAGLSCAATPGLVEECLEALVGRGDAAGALTVVLALLVPTVVFVRLAAVVVRLLRAQRADRAKHLDLLGLLGRHDPALDVTVIAAATPAAYCIPGTGRVVVTDSTFRALDRVELRAVLAHERAHLAGRHDLVVDWATALAQAFPGVPVFQRLRQASADLVELVADDNAVRLDIGDSLANAIAVLGSARSPAPVPSSGFAAAGGRVLTRVHRLIEPPKPLPAAMRIGGAGAALTMVALPALVVVLPAGLAVGLAACPFMFG